MSYVTRHSHLGFAIAAAAPIAAATGPLAPFALGLTALASVLPFIPSIGAGRKEADLIGPQTEQLGNVMHELDNILATQTLSASELQQLDYQMRGIFDSFVEWLYSDTFTADGDTRASDATVAVQRPQVQARLDNIAIMLNAVLGRPKPAQLIQGSGPASLEFRTTSDINLPQAGFLQPGAVSPLGSQYIGPAAAPIDSGLLLKLAIAGGVALIISQR